MAVRKINESTLTAIGNAIRAKTGGSALIDPEDMATEIGSIQTGGASPWELIVDHTSDDILTAVTAEIPTAHQSHSVYKVQFTGQFVKRDYPMFGINGGISYYVAGTSRVDLTVYICKAAGNNEAEINGSSPLSKYIICPPNLNGGISQNAPLKTVTIRSYYENGIASGMNIKVWGLIE